MVGTLDILLLHLQKPIIADGAPNDLQKNSPNPWVRQFFNAQPDAE